MGSFSCSFCSILLFFFVSHILIAPSSDEFEILVHHIWTAFIVSTSRKTNCNLWLQFVWEQIPISFLNKIPSNQNKFDLKSIFCPFNLGDTIKCYDALHFYVWTDPFRKSYQLPSLSIFTIYVWIVFFTSSFICVAFLKHCLMHVSCFYLFIAQNETNFKRKKIIRENLAVENGWMSLYISWLFK